MKSSPSLPRSHETCWSSVRLDPCQEVCHTSRSSCSRVTTFPASATSRASRSNSFGDSESSVSCRNAGRGADAGKQLSETKRLGDVVVGPGVEPVDRVHLLGQRRQQQDLQRVAGGAQPPAHLEAI